MPSESRGVISVFFYSYDACALMNANGAPHPDASTYANKFSGRYEHRVVKGGVGHNLLQEAPQAFAMLPSKLTVIDRCCRFSLTCGSGAASMVDVSEYQDGIVHLRAEYDWRLLVKSDTIKRLIFSVRGDQGQILLASPGGFL